MLNSTLLGTAQLWCLTADEANEDPLTIEPVTKPTLRSRVTLRGTFLILLAIGEC